MDKNLLIGLLIGIFASIIFASALNIAASIWYNGMMWNHNSMMHCDNSNMSHHGMMHEMTNGHRNSTMHDECEIMMNTMHDECEDMMNEHINSTHTNI